MTKAQAREPLVSVIVVSRHRPDALGRCLAALALQDHPGFELVIVADGTTIATRPDMTARRVVFDVPNISRARNAGVMAATGDIVAFIDDDAIAEPGWLSALTASFSNGKVIAATGFTRGPDGMAWQAQGARIGSDSLTIPVQVDGTTLLPPNADGTVSTLGTNCAFRRAALAAVGGFDAAFPYHLDESDVNLRLARQFPDGLTAIVPAAEVTHGLADHAGRRAGVPRDLTQIGLSLARFCARHGSTPDAALNRHCHRLLRAMLDGVIDPFEMQRLERSLRYGASQGAAPPWPAVALARSPCARLVLKGTGPRRAIILSGWHWRAKSLRAKAAQAVAAGQVVTLILLTPTFLPHRVGLVSGGWWEQRGGVWGGSLPGDPPVLTLSRRERVERESLASRLRGR